MQPKVFKFAQTLGFRFQSFLDFISIEGFHFFKFYISPSYLFLPEKRS